VRAIQGTSSGTYASDTGDQFCPYGPGVDGIPPWMDRLLRTMRNSKCARGTGAMDPTPTPVDGLEPMDEEPRDIVSSASAVSMRRKPRKPRVAPMDRGTLPTPQR
jgi:hypothetical protein